MNRSRSVVGAILQGILDSVVDFYDAEGVALPTRRLISAGPPAWDCESTVAWGEATFGHDGEINRETPTSLTGYDGSTLRALTGSLTICRCTPAWPTSTPCRARLAGPTRPS